MCGVEAVEGGGTQAHAGRGTDTPPRDRTRYQTQSARGREQEEEGTVTPRGGRRGTQDRYGVESSVF